MNTDNPAYRAAMDRNAAAAIDALTNQARELNHLDFAEAVERLSLAFQNSRMSRDELAATLAAVAVRTVRVNEYSALTEIRRTSAMTRLWKVLWTRLAGKRSDHGPS